MIHLLTTANKLVILFFEDVPDLHEQQPDKYERIDKSGSDKGSKLITISFVRMSLSGMSAEESFRKECSAQVLRLPRFFQLAHVLRSVKLFRKGLSWINKFFHVNLRKFMRQDVYSYKFN